MSVVRTLLFTLVFYPLTLIAVVLALLTLVFSRSAFVSVVRGWAHVHRWCTAHLLGIRTRVEGNIPTRPVLVASKHQSMFETIELVRLLRTPAVVMKRELADIPGWGRAARLYGVIPVDRSGGAAALRLMMAAARQAFAAGRPILIFPEGTRVFPGDRPPVQPGFAGLYRSLGVEVVPVALDSGRLWPRGRFAKRAGVVTMRFGDPIPAGLPRKDIEQRVHAEINALET